VNEPPFGGALDISSNVLPPIALHTELTLAALEFQDRDRVDTFTFSVLGCRALNGSIMGRNVILSND